MYDQKKQTEPQESEQTRQKKAFYDARDNLEVNYNLPRRNR